MPTLVLLAGLDGTGELFDRFVEELSPDTPRTVVRYPSKPELGYDDLYEIALRALPVAGPLVILGESFSGPIAIRLAANLPSRVLGLVLCCSFAAAPRRSLQLGRAALPWVPFGSLPFAPLKRLLLGRKVDPAVACWVRNVVEGMSSALIASRLKAIAWVDVRSDFERLDIPVLYLKASCDQLVPSHVSGRLKSARPSMDVVELDGPHALLQVQPKLAAEQVQRFLKSLMSSTSVASS